VAVRADITRQQSYDGKRPCPQGVLLARIRAVVDAQVAVDHREVGAAPALRQSLVDLAAAAELMAGELPSAAPALEADQRRGDRCKCSGG